ncbi:MAG: ATP-dependent Clp protease ATP-binding subunit [Clostridia bacterium]|nr:ATP-dependent Clp protease ATP-binding subunit [Clostridia bacterium]
MLCTRCKKNPAMIFMTRMEGDKSVNESLCLPCAKEMGLNLGKMMGDINPEELSMIENEMMDAINSADLPTEDISGGIMSIMNNLFSGGGEKPMMPPHPSAKREKRGKKGEEDKRIIDSYGENLTKKAMAGKLDKVIGRDQEIDRMIQVLNRRTKNNPALIGEPGVGKTAVAEGLAERIVSNQVPVKLRDKEVYLLDFTAIVAGTQYRGQFEARLKAIVDEVKKLGNIILVIDELHNIVGAGDAEGAMSAANILKPALARGDIQVIGATTLSEYRKHIEKDSALERRFQPIIIEEPSVAETIEILKGIRGYYENYHQVKITDEVIEKAAILSERYITDRFLPDKAIDLIDEAGSRANLKNKALATIFELRKQLELIKKEKDTAANEDSIEDYQKAADLKMQECSIQQSIDKITEDMEDVYLTVEDIATVIELQTKIPVKKITEEETKRLLELEDNLHKRIIGQNDAVNAVARTIRRKRAALSKKKRPASFIFVGPTGVGKTETVKALACELFESEEALIRVDMTEYMEKHAVSRLIGSPPGYVGYDDAGQLTEKVRRKPYSVILFDEIEKAHPDVMNIMLQILDDGRVTDSHGKVVSFENTVIVMTSNAGSSYSSSALGFGKTEADASKTRAMEALKKFLRPEFLNRVDEVIVFNPLSKNELIEIVELMIGEIASMASERGMNISVSDEVKEILCEKGFDSAMGARPLRRLVSKEIEDRLAEIVIRGERPEFVDFTVENGEIKTSVR